MGVNKLTLKDKLYLNRRARAHGLPDLWPEAEGYAQALIAGRANAMFARYEETLLGGGGLSPERDARLLNYLGGSGRSIEDYLALARWSALHGHGQRPSIDGWWHGWSWLC